MSRRWQALVPMSTPDLKLPSLSHSQEFVLTMMMVFLWFFDEEDSRTLKTIVNIRVLRMTTSKTLTCDVSTHRAILPRNLSAGNLALSTLHLFM